MAWKQDLAKLKQQLAPEETAPAAKSKPKPAPKPEGPLVLDDEDAVFLSAMGLKPSAKRPTSAAAEPQAPASPEVSRPVPESFQEAIQDLRGFKPMTKGIRDQPEKPKAPVLPPQVLPPPISAPLPEPPTPEALAPALEAGVPRPSHPEPKPESKPEPESKPKPELLATPESFEEAIQGLRGFKPMAKGIRDQPDQPKAPAQPLPAPPVSPASPSIPERQASTSTSAYTSTSAPTPTSAPTTPAPLVGVEAPRLSLPEPEALPARSFAPTRFQLAAGMAIEVDGTLDLRGHTLADALDRLQDRLGDGQVLGWRSLLVTLGQDPLLHEGLLNLMASGQVPMVARYAQAPVPMGGNQAWLLYFAAPSVQS